MTTTVRLLARARRPMTLSGRRVEAGEVIDLAALDLPAGRADLLVAQRRMEYVTSEDDVTVPAPAASTVGAGTAPEPDAVADGLYDLTNEDLRAACRERGLPTYGAKPDLVTRLRASRHHEGAAP